MNTIEYVNAQNTGLIKERNKLIARVMELEKCASMCLSAAADDYSACSDWCYEQSNIINRLPNVSLEAHDREVEYKVIGLLDNMMFDEAYHMDDCLKIMRREQLIREGD